LARGTVVVEVRLVAARVARVLRQAGVVDLRAVLDLVRAGPLGAQEVRQREQGRRRGPPPRSSTGRGRPTARCASDR
jgi:hypothetical protein